MHLEAGREYVRSLFAESLYSTADSTIQVIGKALLNKTALLIGNSDGIGYATTRRLLAKGWNVIGVSRSDCLLESTSYSHHVSDVTSCECVELLHELANTNPIDVCVYFAGIGELFDLANMVNDVRVIDVNLMGMVKAAAAIIPSMANLGHGHFIGVSSFADELLSAAAPSYHASKAGFSSYLESLSLALKPTGVYVTNLRFGFVDTKMAKGDKKPLMIGVEKSVDHVEVCIKRRPMVYAAPRLAIPLVKLRKWAMWLRR